MKQRKRSCPETPKEVKKKKEVCAELTPGQFLSDVDKVESKATTNEAVGRSGSSNSSVRKSNPNTRGAKKDKNASHGACVAAVMPVGGYVSNNAREKGGVLFEFKSKLDCDKIRVMDEDLENDSRSEGKGPRTVSVDGSDSLAFYDDFEDLMGGIEFTQISKKARKYRQESECSGRGALDISATRNLTLFLVENKKLNPFAIRSELRAIVRRENITGVGGRGTLTVKDIDEEEFSSLSLVKDLGGCAVRAKLPAPMSPITRVVIVGVDQGIDTETIVKHSGCLSAHRITKREDGAIKQTTAVILDFPKDNVPAFVCLLFLRFRTRPYVRPPVRCYRCQLFGHVAKHCSRPDKCARCLGSHDTRECANLPSLKKSCASCDGAEHTAGGPECPKKQRAQAINTTMAREGMTYAQAARNVRKENHATPKDVQQNAVAPPNPRAAVPAITGQSNKNLQTGPKNHESKPKTRTTQRSKSRPAEQVEKKKYGSQNTLRCEGVKETPEMNNISLLEKQISLIEVLIAGSRGHPAKHNKPRTC